MHLFSTISSRMLTPKQAIEAALTGLLVAGLALFVVGCGGVGASGDEDETDTTAPAAPSSLGGESKDSMIELTWEAVNAEDLEGYNVYRATTSGGDTLGTPLVQGRTETSYVDKSAENGTTYYYVVTSVDTAANESNPSDVLEKTPFSSPPDQPEE